jgi:hypothetical protein
MNEDYDLLLLDVSFNIMSLTSVEPTKGCINMVVNSSFSFMVAQTLLQDLVEAPHQPPHCFPRRTILFKGTTH